MEPYDLKTKIEDIINNPYKAPEVKYNEILDMLAEAHIEGQKQERENGCYNCRYHDNTIKNKDNIKRYHCYILEEYFPEGMKCKDYEHIIQEPQNDN